MGMNIQSKSDTTFTFATNWLELNLKIYHWSIRLIFCFNLPGYDNVTVITNIDSPVKLVITELESR